MSVARSLSTFPGYGHSFPMTYPIKIFSLPLESSVCSFAINLILRYGKCVALFDVHSNSRLLAV